jgi:hypothetical protein
VDTEGFFELHTNMELRLYISRQARRHSHNYETQQDYRQEAWMRIGLCEGGADIEFYKCQALRAIQAAYQLRRRKQEMNLSVIECMDYEIYEAWQFGHIKKW